MATGRVEHGELRVGDEVRINDGSGVRVDAIEAFRKKLDTAKAGDNVGLLFKKLTKSDLAAETSSPRRVHSWPSAEPALLGSLAPLLAWGDALAG